MVLRFCIIAALHVGFSDSSLKADCALIVLLNSTEGPYLLGWRDRDDSRDWDSEQGLDEEDEEDDWDEVEARLAGEYCSCP